jgi:hypothetical protein
MSTPGSLRDTVRQERLDPLVHHVEVRGGLSAEALGALAGQLEALAGTGVRWLVLDLGARADVPAAAVPALRAASRAMHAQGGELVVVGAAPGAAVRLSEAGLVQLASLDEVLMLLKSPPESRSRGRQPPGALDLPRLDPE